MTTAFQADAFQNDAFQIDGDEPAAVAANLSTGSGRKAKSIPYGWWDTPEEAKADLAEAQKVIAEAKAEVQNLGEVRFDTVEELRAALWFAEVDTKLDTLEAASK